MLNQNIFSLMVQVAVTAQMHYSDEYTLIQVLQIQKLQNSYQQQKYFLYLQILGLLHLQTACPLPLQMKSDILFHEFNVNPICTEINTYIKPRLTYMHKVDY